MKKYLIIPIVVLAGLASCKKDKGKISQEVAVSFPTINFTGSKFVSIHVNDPVPAIAATAYDSLLNEIDSVSYDASVVDNTHPGLYVITFNAKNRYGFKSQDVAFIAVTNATGNLSGKYKRGSGIANVVKVANGLYISDNVGGVASPKVAVYFAQLNDSMIDLPVQPTDGGLIGVGDGMGGGPYGKLKLAPADTEYSYKLSSGGNYFNTTATRVFIKQ
jgi:hypothetical protein